VSEFCLDPSAFLRHGPAPSIPQAWGIRGGNEVAKATMFIGEPSYFPAELVRATGQVVRSLCFLDHLPKNVGQCQTGQIILPGSQVGRQNDIYISFMSKKLEVVAPGVCLAIVSTRVEGHQNPVSEVRVLKCSVVLSRRAIAPKPACTRAHPTNSAL